MKILHTSDWHLGKILAGKKFVEEQRQFFENTFFPLLKDIKPDILLITGDIVDRPNPDTETLFLLKDIFYFLFKQRIPTFIILGNHDSKKIILFKDFLKEANLIIIENLTYFKEPFIFKSKNGEKLYFYLLPYLNLYELRFYLENLWYQEFSSIFRSKDQVFLRDLINFLIKKIEPRIKKPAILLGHFAVEKGVFTGEEIPLKGIGNEEVLPLEYFKSFDFIFLGHLHRLQKIDKNVYYSGSILPYSFEESMCMKGVWLVEIKNGKKIKEEIIPLPPSFKMKIIKGYFKDLITNFKRDDAYIKIILKDELPILDPFNKLKNIFPNLLILEYEKDKNRENLDFFTDFDYFDKKELKLDEEELFKKFYKFVEGKEPKDEIINIFKRHVNEIKTNLEKEGKTWQ